MNQNFQHQLFVKDNMFVIAHNPSKLRVMKLWFKSSHLEFPQVFKSTGSCDKSHYDLIAFAKEQNRPYVIVFEDDAFPLSDVHEKITRAEKMLLEHWDELAIVQLAHHRYRAQKCRFLQKSNMVEVFDGYLRNDNSWAGAWVTFVKNDAFDERLYSLTHSPPEATFDYMKEFGLKYNYADRYTQSMFKKLALISKENVFEHFDIIKNNRIICSPTI